MISPRHLVLLLAAATGASAQTPVDLRASDGTVLKATYFPAARPGPGVLLYHQQNRTRQSWEDVAKRLAAAGIHTLTVDSRSHGASGGAYDQWTDPHFPAARTDAWPGDLDAAFQYLIAQPGVNESVIGVGGAGLLGVDNSVETARRHSSAVKSLVLLSGETLLPELRFLRRASNLPSLFVVADQDEYPPTVEAMEWLYANAASPAKKLIHYSSATEAPWLWYEPYDIGRVPATGNHGTDLFAPHPELPGIIVEWFVTTLIRTPGHAAPDGVTAAAVLMRLESPGGVAQVTRELMEARRTDARAQLFPEVSVDIMAGDHLKEGELQAAIDLLRLNVIAYPTSADAHGDLADALLTAGQVDSARWHADTALALFNAHTVPASSWSDTDERRGRVQRAIERTLKALSHHE